MTHTTANNCVKVLGPKALRLLPALKEWYDGKPHAMYDQCSPKEFTEEVVRKLKKVKALKAKAGKAGPSRTVVVHVSDDEGLMTD